METIESKWQSLMATVSEAIEYLFDNPIMSDVTFLFTDTIAGTTQQIHAHSLVLSIRSPVFYETLHKNMGNKLLVEITDYPYETFLCFMRYLYGADFATNFQTVMELSTIAEQYEVTSLVNKCEEIAFNAELSIDSICDYLEIAIKFQNDALKRKAVDYIGEHGKEIFSTETFTRLSPNALKEILLREVDLTGIQEMDIFNAVINWATQRCYHNKFTVNSTNMRRSLGDLIKLIRFTAMTTEMFTECVESYKGLLTDKEVNSIYDNIANRDTDSNVLGFYKPRLMNLDEIRFECIRFGQGNLDMRKCRKFRSKFLTNREIFLTQVNIPYPRTSKSVKLIFRENKKIIHWEQLNFNYDHNGICLTVPMITLSKPLQLIRKQEYICDVKFDNPEDIFHCRKLMRDQFSVKKGDVEITVFKWTPLFAQIHYKKLN